MRDNLDDALTLMFGHEGGYSSAKTDQGNYFNGQLVGTKYGITGKTLADARGVDTITAEDVRGMTMAEAERIYRNSYWIQSGGDMLPDGLDYAAFDFGVNSGPARAVRVLQQVVGAPVDGVIGPTTMKAVNDYPGGVRKLIVAYCDARMAYLRSIGGPQGFAANGRGWTIRVTGEDPDGKWKAQPGVVGNALKMVSGATTAPSSMPGTGQAKARPEQTSPWLSKETLLQVLPGAGGLAFLAEGDGPVQWAIGAALVIGAVVAAYLIVRKLRQVPS